MQGPAPNPPLARLMHALGRHKLPVPEVLLSAMFGVALVPFATVHAGWRSVIAVLAGVLSTVVILQGLSWRRLDKRFALSLGVMALSGILSALVFLPAGPGMRSLVLPGLAEGLAPAIEQGGSPLLPLALDPRRGMLEWGVGLLWLLLAGGMALSVRDSRSAARTARTLLIGGISLLVVALALRATDATSVWWVTQVPTFSREPFFGTFVNPNHGGVACAALVPLAVALVVRDRGPWRMLAAGTGALLLLGAVASGSRGALLCLAAGMVPLAALRIPQKGRWALAGVAGLGLVAVLVIGVDDSLRTLSEWVVPTALDPGQDVLTGRGDIYGDTLQVIRAAPVLGVGPAGFDDAFRMLKSTPDFSDPVHAHQDLLQLIAERGVVLALVWLAGLGVAVTAAFRSGLEQTSGRRQLMQGGFLGVLSALAMAAMFTFPAHIGALEVLAAVALGAALGLSGLSERDKAAEPEARSVIAVLVVLMLALGSQAWVWGVQSSDSSLFGEAARAEEHADAFVQLGDLESAEAEYRLAIRRRPVNRTALQKLARVHAKQGDAEQMQAALEAATQIHPTLPWPWRDLARLHRALGDEDQALAAWRQALWSDVPEEQQRAMVDEALSGKGDVVEAAKVALPPRGDVLMLGAKELDQAGEIEAAEAYFQEAAVLDSRFGAHYAAALVRWKRPQDALDQLVGTPNTCLAQEVRANAQFKLADYDAAETSYRATLIACGSDDPAAHRRMRIGVARSELARGEKQGLTTLREMVRDDPDDAQIWRILARHARSERDPVLLQKALEGLEGADDLTQTEAEQLAMLQVDMPMFLVLGEDVERKDPPKKKGPGKGSKGKGSKR